jgi:hypothetical protein
VLYLGLSDADSQEDLKKEVDTSALTGLDDLMYVTPLGEGDAEIKTWVRDVTDSRNGLPKTYNLDLANGSRSQLVEVHHSRVIHVAENVLDDEVNGEPALRPVMNRLYDLEKVQGSAAEAYWMVSNPGLVLNTDPALQDVPTDKMAEQIEEYEHDLRRVLKLFGTDAEQLEAQDVDPEPTVNSILKTISGTVRIPQRKLTGTERGDLASTQDQASYLDTISARQTRFAEPSLFRPFIDRLLDFGIHSPPKAGSYTIDWPTLFQLTDLEMAKLKKTEAEAAKALAPLGDIEQLHSREALREFSPIEEPQDAEPPDEADDIDEEIDESDEQVQEQFERLTSSMVSD